MDSQFWHDRWAEKQIGFHEGKPNNLLVKHLKQLGLSHGQRIFLPLCGKTMDIHWLLAQGYKVVGAELSQLAIEELFDELKLTASKQTLTNKQILKSHIHYKADNIDIFVGDLFNLTQAECGYIDAIYDRAALVALPETMRTQYSKHIINISANAPQLVNLLQYDQSIVNGPPFSISDEELKQHYETNYSITLLDSVSSETGLKGKYPVEEKLWLLR